MSYRIAGIDVHKRMLAVVVADIAAGGEYAFDRRMVGTRPEHLRALAAWFVECGVDEVVMESTAQYWRPVWETLERQWAPQRRACLDAVPTTGRLHLAQSQSNRGARGRKRDFADAERLVKRTGRPRANAQFRARCRAAAVADGNAPQTSTDLQPRAAAEPAGGAARRDAHQALQPRVGSARAQRPAHAPDDR